MTNGKHMHPLPAATEDSSTQESQATPQALNTAAGSGLHDANCCASDYYLEGGSEFPEEINRKINVLWQLPDGTVEITIVDLENDIHLIQQWKNGGRKAVSILTGLNLDVVVKYPATFNLLVDTNR